MNKCKNCNMYFNHSINKPYSLSNCSHTICFLCIEKFKRTKTCPICKIYSSHNHINLLVLALFQPNNFDIKYNYVTQIKESLDNKFDQFEELFEAQNNEIFNNNDETIFMQNLAILIKQREDLNERFALIKDNDFKE